MPPDAAEPLRRVHSAREQKDRAAKRQAWNALNQHCPEFISAVRALAERFAITGVEVEAGGETVAWGDTDQQHGDSHVLP